MGILDFRLLPRLGNRYLIMFDLLGLALIPAAALLLLTGGEGLEGPFAHVVFAYTLLMMCVKVAVFWRTGLYTELWAYASIGAGLTILTAAAIMSLVESAAFLLVLIPLGFIPRGFPYTLPIISSLLTVFWISGGRLGIRVLFTMATQENDGEDRRRVLIAGAGTAGALAVKELQNNPHLGIMPVGFVDDDPHKCSRRVHGVPVFGPLGDIPFVVKHHDIDEVIIAMPGAPGNIVRDVVRLCREANVASKTIPALSDIIRGTARIDDVRNIQLEDLLRRGVIQTDTTPVMLLLTGSKVLVTGAGGSIGSELCRQIREFHPSEMILLGHGETSILQITKELSETLVPGMTITPVIGDVRDRDRMDQIFRIHRPDLVFHAAAHKHVYLMEHNVVEAVTNNILGTKTLVDLADRYNAHRFVMVSSDKAVNPTSVMGITKRIAELIVQDAAHRSGKAFVTVRFGNVLGSRGSVVPLFKHQIAIGGPVTVTHPDVTRYFMTIPEAVQLILQAATMGEGGEVFVLDMGEQLKVIDVARDLIRLSGHTEEEIEIKITGLVQGEKMYEELFYEDDTIEKTMHSKIMVCRRNRARYPGAPGAAAQESAIQAQYESPFHMNVATLIEAAQMGSTAVVTDLFRKIVPQYAQRISGEPVEVPSTSQSAGAFLREEKTDVR